MTSINKGGEEKLHNKNCHFKHKQATINSIYWSGLTHHQREEVKKMWKEKSDIHDREIDEVKSNFMKISLGDQVLVQQSYNSI